jgi:hypothetical protein
MSVRLNSTIQSSIVNSGIVANFGTTGKLSVYGGSQPATGGGAATSAALVTISNISWNAATNGTAAITGTRTGTAGTSGSATWARLSGADGSSYVIDGSCDVAGNTPDFIIDNTTITQNGVVTLTAATIIQPAS